MELKTGFYLVDSDGQLKTIEKTRGKPGEERRIVQEPLSFRTINAAKGAASLANGSLAILYVNGEGMVWNV